MSDMPIEQRRAEVARLSAEGLSQRQIAAQLGVDHSTVLRDLAHLRSNGEHQVAEGGPVTDETVLVGVTAEQPSAESFIEAGGVTAPAAPVRHPLPWEQQSAPLNPQEQRAQDGQRALQAIVEVGGSGGWAGVRNNLAVDIGRERAENALSDLQRIGDALQTGQGIVLTPQGRWRLERAEEAARPKPAPAPPRFADLRQTYVDALPGYRRQLQEQARAERLARWERERQAERSLTRFVTSDMLWPGWRVGAERDQRARNLLAIFPPQFDDLAKDGGYIRVWIDSGKDVAALQWSTGGPVIGVWPNSSSDQVRLALAMVFVPAVDPTTEPLPSLEDAQENR